MGILDRFRSEPKPPTTARGASGRGHHHGFLQLEELNRDLQGRMGLEVFDKMWRTDPEVRRNVSMVTNPVVAATWEVEPYGGDEATPRDIEAAEFARWFLFEHMQPNLIGHLAEAIPLMVRSGFAPFEHVWGRAEFRGREVLVPRRLSVRLPRSIFRWAQSADEELEAIVQIIPTGELGGERTIPRSALTYYRVGAEGDNWEGQSMLRAVYKPWFYKDRIERLDALAHEREAIGYPFVYPPAGTSTDSAQLDELDKDIAAMRAGEDARVIMPGPHAQDVEEGGWRVDIMGLGGGGEGSRDPHPTLQYHKDSIAAAFLAEFMRLGQGQGAVGARATAEEQSNPFEASIEAMASIPETEINESLVARAVALNFDDVEGAPKVRMSLADGTSLGELATMASSLVTAGLLTPDHDLEDYLRERGDLPPADPKERERRDAEREAGREAMRQATERGEVGPDGKPTVPPRGGPQGKEAARSLPKGDDKEGNASKRFEDESATFARQDRPLRTFEEQMDLDRIEAAIDGARERFEQAAGARVRAIAQEVARGGKLAKGAEEELAALLEAELSNLYTTGRQTVASELERQGAQFPASFAGERGAMTRRARLAARSIVRRIVEAVERLALGGRAGEADLQIAAEREAAGALRAEALVHAAPALNEGRDDEAAAHAAEIAGAQITSILDGNRCLSPDTQVAVEGGMRRADAIKLGDRLLTHAGRYVPTSAVIVSEVEEELVSVTAGGRTMRLTVDHPVLVSASESYAWRPAGELAVGDLVVGQESAEPRVEVGGDDLALGQAQDGIAPGLKVGSLSAIGRAAERVPVVAVGFDHEVAEEEVDHPRADLSLTAVEQSAGLQALADSALDRGLGVGCPVAASGAVPARRLLGRDDAELASAVATVDEDGRSTASLGAVPSGFGIAGAHRSTASTTGGVVRAVCEGAGAGAEPIAIGVRDGHAERLAASFADLGDPVASALGRAVGAASFEPVGEALIATLAGSRRVLRRTARDSGESPSLAGSASSASESASDPGSAVHTRLIHNRIVCVGVDAIERVGYRGPVYDFTVPGDHTLFAEGLLVHNCNPCADADDDVLRPLDDPVFLANKPPNPNCHGGSRCRCMAFYTLKDEGSRVG